MTLALLEPARMEWNVWLNRIQAEYRDMPGLCLTPAQMQRLWGLEPDACRELIDSLVAGGVLKRTVSGHYVRCGARPTRRCP